MYMAKVNGTVFINHSVRYEGKKVPIFDRINKIRNDLKALLPEIEEDKFLAMASHVRNFKYGKLHYGRRAIPENKNRVRELTPAEKVLLDYYAQNNINASTAYRWFIACRIPSDLMERLKEGKVSYKKVMEIADNRKKSKLSNLGLTMMEEINDIIRGF